MNLTTLEWFIRYFLLTSVCRLTRRCMSMHIWIALYSIYIHVYRGIILRYIRCYIVFPCWRLFEYILRELPDVKSRPEEDHQLTRGKDLKEFEEVSPNERTSKRACGSSRVYMYMAAGVFMRTERTPKTCVTWRKMVRHIRNENAVEGNWKSKLRSGTTKRQRAALDLVLRQIRKSLYYNWYLLIVYAVMEWLELEK